MRNFYDLADAGLATGAAHFLTIVTPTAAPTYGLLPSDLTSFTTANTAYQTSYAAAINPTTRTSSVIRGKQVARTALVDAARAVAQKINGTRTVTDQMKMDAGIKPRAYPSPIQPITEKPTLEILKVDGNLVLINVRQPDKAKRGKISGAYGIQVMSYVGETAPNDLSLWKMEGNATIQKLTIAFPVTLPAFTKVWLCAGWITPRLQAGPACAPVTVNLGTFVVQSSAEETMKIAA